MGPRIRLFRLFGIEVFLHWSWFLVAAYEIQSRTRDYTSPVWNAAEYFSLFLIVLLHEFGHALACRQVGGIAERIVLWPLGGVAYASPPPRPGALLWTIAAGPLVNVALIPVFWLLAFQGASWVDTAPNAYLLTRTLRQINFTLLAFNLLPVYPLDGGQILQALLWFWLGRSRSLMVATSIGLLGAGLVVAVAFWAQSWWLGFIALFILSQCWAGFKYARMLSQRERAPASVPPPV